MPTLLQLLTDATEAARLDAVRLDAVRAEADALREENKSLRAKLEPSNLIDLKAGDTFPASIPAGHTVRLARGATFALPAKVKLQGDGIKIIGAPGDGALPAIRYDADCFDAIDAGNLVLSDFAIQGRGRFINMGRSVVRIQGIRIDGITENSFIEQSGAIDDVEILDCFQAGKIHRYGVYFDGARWRIEGNTFGPSGTESVIRSSSVKSVDCIVRNNTINAVTKSKAAFDFRLADRLLVEGNTFSGGPMAFGDSSGKMGSYFVQNNRTTDDSPIEIEHSGGNITVADNDARIMVSEPAAGKAFQGLIVKSDREVRIIGNLNPSRFLAWSFIAPKVTSYTTSGGLKVVTELNRGAVK